MSGICGVYRLNGEPATTECIRAMLASLEHRGPDAHGVWSEGCMALGHCMLWVTPESLHERLPRTDVRCHYSITADARIDNRNELFCSLGLSEPLEELTDSALILAAYERWGEECPAHLMGDFAFAVWDSRRRVLFCACDPMGVRSLYYYRRHDAFFFASEIKALLALPEIPRRLNELRVAEYLVTLFEDRSGTFYKDIVRLPGGCSLTVGERPAEPRRYWSLDPTRELRLKSDGEYVEAFREQFTEAVRCRMRSAFPIGTTLSGGLDSSSIACLTRNLNQGAVPPVHTFSCVFPGLPDEDRRVIDERREIKAVLDGGGFVPHYIEADRLSPMWQVERMHYHLDHANYAPNLYLHWAMYDAARAQGVRVLLDGFDGDSTVSHGFEYLAELGQSFRWGTLRREVDQLSQHHLRGIPRSRIIREYCIKPLTPRWAWLLWHLVKGRRREAFSENILISESLKRRTGIVRRARTLLRDQYSWSLTRSARENHFLSLNQALYSYTLEIADKASAAFGVEARYPFFDRRLMEFCLALPARQKLGQGWNRWILRRAMEGILPPAIQWRPKKGNLSPNFHRRLLDFERERLEEFALHDQTLDGFVDREAMQAVYREYQRTHVRTQGESIQLFAAVNLALWLRSTGFSS